MDELLSVLTSLLSGFLGAGLLLYVRDIYLYSKRAKEQRTRARVRRQLEKLYTPLYVYIKKAEFLTGLPTLAIEENPLGMGPSESRQKEFLDSIVENYTYLADDELTHDLLPRIHGAGFYKKENQETVRRVAELTLSGYQKLRKEYFAT
jgi:hypothetical protein